MLRNQKGRSEAQPLFQSASSASTSRDLTNHVVDSVVVTHEFIIISAVIFSSPFSSTCFIFSSLRVFPSDFLLLF